MNPIQKQQQKELEKIEICIDILKNARNELYLSMRFFDVILSGFEFLPDTKISGMGTDGFTVYFYPDYLIGLYQRTPVQVNRAYLHMIFHCLFGHLKQPDHADEQCPQICASISKGSLPKIERKDGSVDAKRGVPRIVGDAFRRRAVWKNAGRILGG